MIIRVYPEYFNGDVAENDVSIFARMIDGGFSRMCLIKDGIPQLHYDKICSDGHNTASNKKYVPAAYECNDLVIGLICCMDVDRPNILSEMKERLDLSKCTHKMIAISSFMSHTGWFSSPDLSPNFHGYYVALSNGCEYGVKSFIANPNGNKISGLSINIGSNIVYGCGIT